MTSIRRRLLFFAFVFFLIGSLSLGSFLLQSRKGEGIAIAGKNTEGHILAELFAQLIEHETGIKVYRKYGFDATLVIFNGLKTGEIDLYVEYTGTALSAILNRSVKGKTGAEVFQEVKTSFLEKYDMLWLDPLGFQSTYALMMEKEVAERLGIETLSDLKRVLEKTPLRIFFDQEFYARPEMEILKENYQMQFSGIKLMDHALLYLTLERKGCDVINGYTTDGFCMGLKILKDDQRLLPSYEAVPLTRRETIEKYPSLIEVTSKLKGLISEEEMQKLNYAVEKKGENIYDVAHTFLKKHMLINS